METNETSLIEAVNETGIEPARSEQIVKGFGTLFEQARAAVIVANMTVVNGEDDTAGMATAREVRLSLKHIRCEVEDTRKSMKESIVREGKAIDGAANILKAIIIPAEEKLEQMEKTAELAARRREDEKCNARLAILTPLMGVSVAHLDVRGMSDEEFDAVVADAKETKRLRDEADAKAEAEKKARDEAEAARRAEIEKENERLKAEAAEREKAAAEERRAAEEKAALERQAREAERKELEAKAEAERQAREKIEREQRAKEEAEAKRRREEEEAKERADAAPDKDKLLQFVRDIEALLPNSPVLKTKKARALLEQAQHEIVALAHNIHEKIVKL